MFLFFLVAAFKTAPIMTEMGFMVLEMKQTNQQPNPRIKPHNMLTILAAYKIPNNQLKPLRMWSNTALFRIASLPNIPPNILRNTLAVKELGAAMQRQPILIFTTPTGA